MEAVPPAIEVTEGLVGSPWVDELAARYATGRIEGRVGVELLCGRTP